MAAQDGIRVRRGRFARREDRLAGLIRIVIDALTGMGILKHDHSKSKHTYSDHSEIALLVLRQHLDVSYGSLCQMLPSMRGVMNAAGIGGVPDPSTLRKFSMRLDNGVLDDVLGSIALMTCASGMVMAVDATGFSCSNASRHYVKRMKEMGSYVSSIRNYTKATLAVDTSSLVVLACVTSVSNVHDVKHIPHLIDRIAGGGYDVRYVIADRGYDAEHVHERIRAQPGADTAIPVRDLTGTAVRGKRKVGAKGKNRRRMETDFPEEVYRHRCLIETVNSMIKRKMGDTVYGHSDATRHVEVMCRCIAHNVMRLFALEEV